MTIGEKVFQIFMDQDVPEEVILAFKESPEINRLIQEVLSTFLNSPIEGFFRLHILCQICFMTGKAIAQEEQLEKLVR